MHTPSVWPISIEYTACGTGLKLRSLCNFGAGGRSIIRIKLSFDLSHNYCRLYNGLTPSTFTLHALPLMRIGLYYLCWLGNTQWSSSSNVATAIALLSLYYQYYYYYDVENIIDGFKGHQQQQTAFRCCSDPDSTSTRQVLVHSMAGWLSKATSPCHTTTDDHVGTDIR